MRLGHSELKSDPITFCAHKKSTQPVSKLESYNAHQYPLLPPLIMNEFVDQVVLPGDVLGQAAPDKVIKLGSGLWQDQDVIIATKAGVLRCKAEKYWVENSQKRFVPAVDDLVVGIITEKLSEGWKVDVGAAQIATLSIYAFEGGTKRNRANLPQGSLVYARVSLANKDVEPEISCVTSGGKAEGFGPLVDGYMFKCSTGLARHCLSSDCIVLNELGKYIPFEVAVGINGRIWVNSTSTTNCTIVANSIINSEFLDAESIIEMVKKLVNRAKKEK